MITTIINTFMVFPVCRHCSKFFTYITKISLHKNSEMHFVKAHIMLMKKKENLREVE